MTTVAERIAKKNAPAEKDWEAIALPMLPPDMPAPTISNGTDKDKPNVWLTFRRPYGDERPGSAFLAELESAGFKTLPATLAKYGDWRRTVKLGLQDQIPETSSRSELVDSEPIAPIWVVPCQHCGTDAIGFYEKDGITFRVTVPGPKGVYVHAHRVETHGDWHFERGSAKLRYPDGWHAVTDSSLTPIAQVSIHSRAYVDTEKGISGAIYFTPFLDHADFPMTGSQFLAALEA